jgi:hypothetical protein
MSTDTPEVRPTPEAPQPPTLEAALSHLVYLNAVTLPTFKEWVNLNPGGVCELIRALFARLPMTETRPALLAMLASPAPSQPAPGVVSEAMVERAARAIGRNRHYREWWDVPSNVQGVLLDDARAALTAALNAPPAADSRSHLERVAANTNFPPGTVLRIAPDGRVEIDPADLAPLAAGRVGVGELPEEIEHRLAQFDSEFGPTATELHGGRSD